jgi:hypothetical protein
MKNYGRSNPENGYGLHNIHSNIHHPLLCCKSIHVMDLISIGNKFRNLYLDAHHLCNILMILEILLLKKLWLLKLLKVIWLSKV